MRTVRKGTTEEEAFFHICSRLPFRNFAGVQTVDQPPVLCSNAPSVPGLRIPDNYTSRTAMFRFLLSPVKGGSFCGGQKQPAGGNTGVMKSS